MKKLLIPLAVIFIVFGLSLIGIQYRKTDDNGFYINSKYKIHSVTKTIYSLDGFDITGYSKDGYNKQGYNKDGYDKNGFNSKGYNKEGYNKKGYNKQGYDKYGYDKNGFNNKGYDKEGYDKEGYNKKRFDRNGIHKYTHTEFNEQGYNKKGFNKQGYNKKGFNILGYDKLGADKNGVNKEGKVIHGSFTAFFTQGKYNEKITVNYKGGRVVFLDINLPNQFLSESKKVLLNSNGLIMTKKDNLGETYTIDFKQKVIIYDSSMGMRTYISK